MGTFATRRQYRNRIFLGTSPAAGMVMLGDTAAGAGAKVYGGCRCYSTAKIGQRAMQIVVTGGSLGAVDVFYGANGYIDLSNINSTGMDILTWIAANGGTGQLMCRLLYEQVNNVASGVDLVPLTVVDAVRGIMMLGDDAGTSQFEWDITGLDAGDPFTLAGSMKPKEGAGNSALFGSVIGPVNWQLVFNDTNNSFELYQFDATGSPITAASAGDAWHSLVAVDDLANSCVVVDGVRTTGTFGANQGICATTVSFGSFFFGGNPVKGRYFDGGIWLSSKSTSDQDAIATNIAAAIADAGLT